MSDKIDRKLCEYLISGAFEEKPWSQFLDHLCHLTRSDFTVLQLRPSGRPLDQAVDIYSTTVDTRQVLEFSVNHFSGMDPNYLSMEEGKLYSHKTLFELNDRDSEEVMKVLPQGRFCFRQMRIDEPSGVAALLTIIRRGQDYRNQEETTLSSLAPLVKGVLRHHVTLERERYQHTLSSRAIKGLQFTWLALDEQGKILAQDERIEIMDTLSDIFYPPGSGQLKARSTLLQREIISTLKEFSINEHARTVALPISREPWLDMLLVPNANTSIATSVTPVAIAYIHGDNWLGMECCDQLSDLFGLTPSEARLAFSLCRGMTITEAAAVHGLSEGSARTYTKTIYAKMGAKGLPDLIRIVMRSVLVILPNDVIP